MSVETAELGTISLGQFLRKTRVGLGIDLTSVVDETRISQKNLEAIEKGDYEILPADAFARGFYGLYAKLLSLDPKDILEKYEQERGLAAQPNTTTAPPPNRLAKNVSDMAERPSSLPFSSFVLIVMLFLLFGAFLCWYFSWNPASFLSQKLRSLQNMPDEIEQVYKSMEKPTRKYKKSFLEIARAERKRLGNIQLLDMPTSAFAQIPELPIVDDVNNRPQELEPESSSHSSLLSP